MIVLQLSDANVSELHFKWPLIKNAVHLQTDKTAGVCLVNILTYDVVHKLSVNPRSHTRSFSHDPQLIPSFILKVVMACMAK